jgi:hypothetical protein
MNIIDSIDLCTTYNGCLICKNKLFDGYTKPYFNPLINLVHNMEIILNTTELNNIFSIKRLLKSIIFFENYVQNSKMVYFIKVVIQLDKLYIDKTFACVLIHVLYNFDLFDIRVDDDLYSMRDVIMQQYEFIILGTCQNDFLNKFIQSCIQSMKNKIKNII